jgi:hypothetical protein
MVEIVREQSGSTTSPSVPLSWFEPVAGRTLILVLTSRTINTTAVPAGWVEDKAWEPEAFHPAVYVWRKQSAATSDTGLSLTDVGTTTQWRIFECTGVNPATINTAHNWGGSFVDTSVSLALSVPAGDFTFGAVGIKTDPGDVDWGAVAREATARNTSLSMGSFADTKPAGATVTPTWPTPGRVSGALVTYLSVANSPPVARSAGNIFVQPGASFSLDFRDSSDAEDAPTGDPTGLLLDYATVVQDAGGTGYTTGALTGAATATPSGTAPAVTGTIVFRCTVTDAGALTGTVDVTVSVESPNTPPFADAGASQAKLVSTVVTLDASGSSDFEDTLGLPDTAGTPALSYQWTQLVGTPVTLTPASGAARSVTFTAPAAAEAMEFQVTVTDTDGVSTIDTTKVLVATASAQDQFTAAPVESDGHAKTATTLFQAHLMAWEDKAAAGAVGTRTATFTDTSGQPGPCAVYGTLVLRSAVGVVNTPPVANAGVDQTAIEGTLVTLNGTGSSDVETPAANLTYAWTVTDAGGTSLTTGQLVGANTAVCSFTAPGVTVAATITLQLIVTDEGGLPSPPDSVAVMVNPAPVVVFPDAELPTVVALRLGGAMTDVTEWLVPEDNIEIEHPPDQAGQVNYSKCRLTLRDDDGRFSADNPFSPYYGLLNRNVQLRVTTTHGADYVRCWLEVPRWPKLRSRVGDETRFPVEAVGIIHRISKSVPAVRSVLRRQIPRVLTNLVGYWPCEDQPGRTRLASGLSDGEPMRRHSDAAASLASYDGFAASAPIMTLNDSDWRGQVEHYTFPSGEAQCQLGFLLRVGGSGSTAGQTIIHLEMTGTAQQWEIRYETASNGSLQIRCKKDNGVEILNSGTLHTGVNGDNCLTMLRLTKVSTLIRYELYCLKPGQDEGVEHQGSLSGGYSLGRVEQVVVNSGGGHSDVAIGHITVQSEGQNFNRLSGPLKAYEGEKAGIRIQRLCAEHNLPFASIGDLNDTERMGPQRVGALWDLLRDAADTDAGILYEPHTAFALGYRTRRSLYNQTPKLAFTHDGWQLADAPQSVADDTDVANDITVTGPRGEARAVLTSGALSIQDPPGGVGEIEDAVDINAEGNRFADHAWWRLRLRTVDEPRYPIISASLNNPYLTPFTHAIMTLTPGDRITVTEPAGVISQLAVGWTETIKRMGHDFAWTCVPESPYQVGLIGDRADTAGSTLAAQVAAGATSMSVATPSGILWGTTTFPFDVMVAGIRVTVTNITGSTSPQTFTVTAATVTKILPLGSKVTLADPADAAL